jgi:Zn-dependent M16 (insulinase) family peptidase
MKEILDEKKSHMESDLQAAGHRAAVLRASAGFSKSALITELLSGITGYRLTKKYAEKYDEAAHKELTDNLYELMKYLFRKENLLVSYTAASRDYGDVEEMMSRLADSLHVEAVTREAPSFNPLKKKEAFRTSGQVQYVAIAGHYRKNGLEYTGAMRVLQVILGYNYLRNQIRVKGGAYGVMGGCIHNGDSYLATYRDPHLKRSLDIFHEVSTYLRNFDADEREMTQYVIGAVGDVDVPRSPGSKGAYGMTCYMCEADMKSIQKHRDEMLDVTVEDIRKLADHVDAFIQDESICVVGTPEKIAQHSDIFDSIEQL